MDQRMETAAVGAMAKRPIDPEKLFAEYVAVCNQAIGENADRFWYRYAKRLNEKLWGGASFRALIYDDDPGALVGEAILHFDARAAELRLLPPGDHDIAFSWKTPLDYLEDVAYSRPQWYIENPLRLDWSWMKERLRDEVRYRVDGRALMIGAALGALAGVLLSRRGKKRMRRT